MDANEILRRSRISGEDEGRDFVNKKANGHGFVALCLTVIALASYKAAKGLPVGDITSLMFIFLSVGMFARYRADGERFSLLFGALTGLGAIAMLASYVATTW